MLDQWEAKAEILCDAYTFGTVEVGICDVKEVVKSDFGVPGFWLKVLLAHRHIAPKI